METTALSGPALRYRLLELFLPHGAGEALERAVAAHDWIADGSGNAPIPAADIEEKTHEEDEPWGFHVAGGTAAGGGEADRDSGGDVPTQSDSGRPVSAEPGDPAPAQGAGADEDASEGLTEPAVRPSRWPSERIAELERLWASGMPTRDIAARMGMTEASVRERVNTFGINKRWPRARGRAPKHPVVPIAESSAEDFLPPQAPEEPKLPPPPPPSPSPSERERMIEEHVRTKGVTTTPPDFGADQPAVDVLRSAYHSVVRSNDPKSPWLINGMRCPTKVLWDRANAELKARRQKPIKRSA